jgi:hypothetical protein
VYSISTGDPKIIGGVLGSVALTFALRMASKKKPGAERPSVDPCPGLRKQLQDHMKKLEDYKADPDKWDNNGFLKNASPERRKKIIEGRIRNLEQQIENFRRQVENAGGGD